MKMDHLIADVVCISVYLLILMWATWCWCWWWLWETKITVYLTTLPPCPGHPHWPGSYHWTPSPQSSHLLLGVAAGSPLSWSHHLGPHWTSLWARDSAQSSRKKWKSRNCQTSFSHQTTPKIVLFAELWYLVWSRACQLLHHLVLSGWFSPKPIFHCNHKNLDD